MVRIHLGFEAHLKWKFLYMQLHVVWPLVLWRRPRYTLVQLTSHFTHDAYVILHRKNSGSDAFKNNCIPYAVKGKGLLLLAYMGFRRIAPRIPVLSIFSMQISGCIVKYSNT